MDSSAGYNHVFIFPFRGPHIQQKQLPVLFWGSGAPAAWRVIIALEEKGVQYDSRMLSFERGDMKTKEMLQLNPRGKLWRTSARSYSIKHWKRGSSKPLLPPDFSGMVPIFVDVDGTVVCSVLPPLFFFSFLQKTVLMPTKNSGVWIDCHSSLSWACLPRQASYPTGVFSKRTLWTPATSFYFMIVHYDACVSQWIIVSFLSFLPVTITVFNLLLENGRIIMPMEWLLCECTRYLLFLKCAWNALVPRKPYTIHPQFLKCSCPYF